jgi:hypothetical protein
MILWASMYEIARAVVIRVTRPRVKPPVPLFPLRIASIFLSGEPWHINPSPKSNNPSVWCRPVRKRRKPNVSMPEMRLVKTCMRSQEISPAESPINMPIRGDRGM